MTDLGWIATLITIAIALYGAVLSTYNLYMSRKEKLWQVKVKTDYGLLFQGEWTEQTSISVSAANVGHRVVTLVSAGFILPDKRRLFNMGQENVSHKLPYELSPGKSYLLWLDAQQLAKELKSQGFSGKIKLTGFCIDGIGTIFKSKPFKFDINEWEQKSREA